MSEWKEYAFSEFTNVNPAVRLTSGKNYSFVEMKDLTDGQKFCSPNAERVLSGGSRFQERDTLFARITPCLENGKICQVKNLKEGVGFGSTEFLVFRGKKDVSDNDFVFYLSRWSEVRNFAESHFDGSSGRQRVPSNAFDYLILNLPPLPEQRAIASVLGSLDDKIDLLHRQNRTLEALAGCVWRGWFGKGGEDWEERGLLELIELVGGGTPKTSEQTFWDGEIGWLSGGDIASNHKGFVLKAEKNITRIGLENSSTKLLPKFSTVISARGTVGKFCLLGEPMAFSQSNYGIKPKIEGCWFFSFLLISHCVEELQAAAYGSVFDTITTATFRNLKVRLPEKSSILVFENKVKPFFEKMLTNQTQLRTLTQLRDTLLPKLMSGEVRVR